MTGRRAPAAVVPAAGRGRRFGGPKLLAPAGGVPMLEATVRSLLDAGVARVAVVVGPDSEVRAAANLLPVLADPRVAIVVNPDPGRGMLSSIQAGLAAVDGEPVLVLPGDMPYVRPATIVRVLDAAVAGGVVVSPRFDGRRGHPVALTARAAAAVLAASATDLSDALTPFKGDRLELDVDDPGIHRDVDRPADLV